MGNLVPTVDDAKAKTLPDLNTVPAVTQPNLIALCFVTFRSLRKLLSLALALEHNLGDPRICPYQPYSDTGEIDIDTEDQLTTWTSLLTEWRMTLIIVKKTDSRYILPHHRVGREHVPLGPLIVGTVTSRPMPGPANQVP